MKKRIIVITSALMLMGCSTMQTTVAPKLNTQINADFIQMTQGKTPEQLADLAYQQAMVQWHDKFIDRCTKVQVSKLGNQVIFDNLLMDDVCGGKIRNSTPSNIAELMQSGKSFRINEITKTPTAVAIINGGVVQIYRYYLMPEKKLIGEFSISKQDIN